jgi:YVTN family beta-propeller protein
VSEAEELLARYLKAQQDKDLEALMSCWHPDVEVVHPMRPDRNWSGLDTYRRQWKLIWELTPHSRFEVVSTAVVGDRVYLEALTLGGVTPISTATNRAGRQVRIGGDTEVLAITPNGRTVYVVSHNGTVTPISTATNRPGRPIRVGVNPVAIAMTPNSKTVYVLNSGDNTVTPIATATNRPGRPIRVGIMPEAIAITPNGLTVYVANLDSNTVTPISTATNRPGRAIRVGSHPDDIAITP